MTTVEAGRGHGTRPGYAERKDDHLERLRKVEGQVRGIARMVGEDRYCIDVLTQVAAATRALQQVALGLLDDHLRHCVVDAVAAGPEHTQAKLDELSLVLRRAVRL
jgi:CsoR family transcriptional regulator, copper-sensing transcriptional repressor